VRWLGRVPFDEAYVLQRALVESPLAEDHLLALEHPHVFTLGRHGDPSHVLVDPASVGASLVKTDRGGDVTYHGPGQLVVYPILSVPLASGALPGYVRSLEQAVIDSLHDLGLGSAGRLEGYPGVWIDPEGSSPRKICAIGTRLVSGRSMHGLALNVSTDLGWFGRIIPCGIPDKAVTSLEAEGLEVSMREVLDRIVENGVRIWGHESVERQDVAWSRSLGLRPGGLPIHSRKPPWLRVPARMGERFLETSGTIRGLGLVTVCEEAGCPNIFECWAEGTATFMVNGDRCTRACGFCKVDTRRPLALDPREPERVAEAAWRMGLEHVVVTAVARDDLPDGGAGAIAKTIDAVRSRLPACRVEVLIPDCKGDANALDSIFAAHPDVLNHNLETVPRLQRRVRPSAGYARSLAVLARAKAAGLVTKSGIMVGLGEERSEISGVLADLRAVGVDIVTIGQYLRPSESHLPVARWWTREQFEDLRELAMGLGFAHVEASPLTRSSHHAKAALESITKTAVIAVPTDS
jgi:lipoic acid synthetase